jgi:monoamine oxidase
VARTPAFAALLELFDADARSTRREVLRTSAGAAFAGSAIGALGCGGGGSSSATSRSASRERVAIVGAGLAGLCCARELRKRGVHADLYEANERLGGRCWTVRDVFAEGQIAEHGGELIDSGHAHIRALAKELGLPLDNVNAAEAAGTRQTLYFDGALYPDHQAALDIAQIRPALKRDLHAAGYPTLYNHHNAAGLRLDRMSISDWVAANVPGGRASRLGRFIEIGYTTEFGGEASDQSALNLIYLAAYTPPGGARLFGRSNERFHVHGGNDLIVKGVADGLDGQITTGARLTSIRLEDGGGYRLSFDGAPEVVAGKVVLAIPFAVMRESVEYSRAGFSELKRTAIRDMGMGTNSKLQLQFASRPWIALGSNGESTADTGYQLTWEVTRAQPGKAGILVDFTGGRIGDSFGTGSPADHARRFLRQIDPVLPGVAKDWNGRVELNHWASDPLANGSYSYYRVGQLTGFSGVEREPSGRCHFAGEHTSIAFQGYLEGAVRSGQRAAGEVLAA